MPLSEIVLPLPRVDRPIGVPIGAHPQFDIVGEFALIALAIWEVVCALSVGQVVSEVPAVHCSVGKLQHALPLPKT